MQTETPGPQTERTELVANDRGPMQQPLFSDFPIDQLPARKSDPETSHEAAAKVELKPNQQCFVRVVGRLGTATAKEVKAFCISALGKTESEAETVRKRQRECERLGFIETTGERRDGCQVYRKVN